MCVWLWLSSVQWYFSFSSRYWQHNALAGPGPKCASSRACMEPSIQGKVNIREELHTITPVWTDSMSAVWSCSSLMLTGSLGWPAGAAGVERVEEGTCAWCLSWSSEHPEDRLSVYTTGHRLHLSYFRQAWCVYMSAYTLHDTFMLG